MFGSLTSTQLTVYDVFLFDQDFKIERPTRYYRQGLNLLTGQEDPDHHGIHSQASEKPMLDNHSHVGSTLGSIRSRVSNFFSFSHHHKHHHNSPNGHLQPNGEASTSGQPSQRRRRSDSESSGSSGSESDSEHERPLTPMLDPSTNTNPLEDHTGRQHDDNFPGHGKTKRTGDVSKHVFYIENSQMRLKLFAKNEVLLICVASNRDLR